MKLPSRKVLLTAISMASMFALFPCSADTIYVADPFAGAIDKFDTNGVASVFAITSLGSPAAIAFDKAGNLYVANNSANTVEKFTPGGLFSIFAKDPGDGSILARPSGVAIDAAGNLYVTSQSDAGTIEKYTTNGVASLFAADPGDGSILKNPAGMVFDKSGNLYVANTGNNSIEKFDTNGNASTFVIDTNNGALLNAPEYLALDSAGNLYSANFGGVIMKFDTLTGSGTPFATNSLSSVAGLTFDTNGNLYAASFGSVLNSQIEKFPPSGTGTVIATGGSVGIQNPQGIAFDSAGNLSVADAGVSDNIIKLSPGGTFLGKIFPSIDNPQGMALDAAGNLYVANNSGGTIEKFDTNGVGTLFDVAAVPFGLAFDTNGNLFVSSGFGSFITEFPTNGSSFLFITNGLDNPEGLAFDTSGNLFAINVNTNIIVKITPNGNGAPFGPGGPFGPFIAFDASGNLFAVVSNTILKIAPNGSNSAFVTDPGDGSLINGPQGLAFDSAGNLYLGNENNKTIIRFNTNGNPSLFASNIFQSISGIVISRSSASSGGGSLTLQSIGLQHINPGQTLVLTNVAIDTDPGPPALTFSLLSTTPTNATLGVANGVFNWRPLISQANSTNVITVKVTENSAPGASATNSFTVVVNPATQPDITSFDISSGHAVLHVSGISGPDYILQTTTNLNGPWHGILTNSSPVPPITITDTNALAAPHFYRIQLGP